MDTRGSECVCVSLSLKAAGLCDDQCQVCVRNVVVYRKSLGITNESHAVCHYLIKKCERGETVSLHINFFASLPNTVTVRVLRYS